MRAVRVDLEDGLGGISFFFPLLISLILLGSGLVEDAPSQ